VGKPKIARELITDLKPFSFKRGQKIRGLLGKNGVQYEPA